MRKGQYAKNFQAEGAAPAKALSWGRRDICLSKKRPLWLQKVNKGERRKRGGGRDLEGGEPAGPQRSQGE